VGCGVGYCWLLLFSIIDDDVMMFFWKEELVAVDFDGIGNSMEGN
jgi:hypothetical protein